jgi:hypothetical protein
MLRPVLLAAALAALVAPVRAADPDVSGNWLLTWSPRGGTDQAFAIVKIEVKDGKPAASMVSTPIKGSQIAVNGIEVGNGKKIRLDLKFNAAAWSFEGALGEDGKTALGNLGADAAPNRARLTRTDKTELTPAEATVRPAPPAPVAESQKLAAALNTLRSQALREKDADKKKEWTEKAEAAQKEFDEKQPGLLREVLAGQADTPFGLDAATELLRGGTKYKVTPEEAVRLFTRVEQAAAPYGPRYVRAVTGRLLEGLASQKGLEPAVVAVAGRVSKTFSPDAPAAYQVQVLTAYKTALEASSVADKDATLETLTATLTRLEARIDAEYLKTMPPFKPTPYAGRKETGANRVVVMELFTGAQCPPCVAADVAFDALEHSYKPTELVLIQYHLHIPGPDPLTNTDTVDRAKYYSVRSTPSTLFDGKSQAGGGGGMANAENKFRQYTSIIDPLLEGKTAVKVAGTATRNGDRIDIAVEVAGAEGGEMRLRLLVVEEAIKYVGGNQLRFHHQVVRAMPGGADGVAIKDKGFKHSAAVDLVDVRKGLTRYLDDFAATRPFPYRERPMDLKSLRVIALVQDDKTKEIVQALQIEVFPASCLLGT